MTASAVRIARRRPARLAAAALVAAAVATLAGCASAPVAPTAPRFYDRLDAPGRSLDLPSSLAMINLYRSNAGLAPLATDPALQRLAEAAAHRMADENRVLTEAELTLPAAFAATGIAGRPLAANLSGGYRTFAETFSGWREAKAQNAHMLTPTARRVGLAAAWRPQSKYEVFWVMIVADPS
jgi:uncharacterized protein YkwD